MERKKKRFEFTASLKAGVIAFVFLLIGFEAGLFLVRSGERAAASGAGAPAGAALPAAQAPADSAAAPGAPAAQGARASRAPAPAAARRPAPAPERFPFDPNTISAEDLQRLGFSPKQAQAILNYRNSGGRFRRKADFAKSFVVSEDLFAELEPYIEIPKVDLNRADSAALDGLPGIGPYYVRKILEYRQKLRGFSYPEQLMDIERFDAERYDGLSDLIETGPSEPYPLWTLPEDSLKLHPYIGSYAAHGVVLFRDHTPRSGWTVEALDAAGILKPGTGEKLARCRIAAPTGSGDDAPEPPAAR
jgi:DNA uptake protein ComE-like DNA-binding protein